MESFRAVYNEEWCSALYECYESGDDFVLNDLLENLCPLIRKVYLFEAGQSGTGDQNLIEADALQELFRIISAKCIPNHHSRVFTKFLRTIIVRSIRDSFQRLSPQIFDYWKVARTPTPEPLPAQEVAELRIYKAQVRNCIKLRVLSRIRFLGDEGEACKLILDCLLGYKDLDPKVARRRYRLSSYRCNYLIRYVQIVIKASTYDQRACERKGGAFSSVRSASGSVLRTPGYFR